MATLVSLSAVRLWVSPVQLKALRKETFIARCTYLTSVLKRCSFLAGVFWHERARRPNVSSINFSLVKSVWSQHDFIPESILIGNHRAVLGASNKYNNYITRSKWQQRKNVWCGEATVAWTKRAFWLCDILCMSVVLFPPPSLNLYLFLMHILFSHCCVTIHILSSQHWTQ